MQDVIIKEILKNSLLPANSGHAIVESLFKANCYMPNEVLERRPSFLNFNKVIEWGGTVENAHIASISCLNSKHGCFGDAYDLIKTFFNDPDLIDKENTRNFIYDTLNRGSNIPGFGSPVFKGLSSLDYRCNSIKGALESISILDDLYVLISIVQNCTRKEIDANLVFWNAAAIYCLGLSREYASLIFILASQITYINILKEK
jgi:hypothetical protein